MISAEEQDARIRKMTFGFSAIARSVMISAARISVVHGAAQSFSAIARSVMISADDPVPPHSGGACFSAIARSVMISAAFASDEPVHETVGFSAIARSVMISARTPFPNVR